MSLTTIKEFLSYDDGSGSFKWIAAPSDKVRAGDEAGSVRPDGYVIIGFGGVLYLAHRLAWWFEHGEWPERLDHADQDRANNRLSNLRPASRSQNAANMKLRDAASSRFRGVTWDRARGKWKAAIGVDRKMANLGRFNAEEEAARAYDTAARKHFGEFARCNFNEEEQA